MLTWTARRLGEPCIVICLAAIATQLESVSSKKATKMQAALILRMNTAPAAQSLAILMLGCRPGCRWSIRCSRAVLKSSAARTKPQLSSNKAHQIMAGRFQPSTISTMRAARHCSRKLDSMRKAALKPCRANPMRLWKGWFFIHLTGLTGESHVPDGNVLFLKTDAYRSHMAITRHQV